MKPLCSGASKQGIQPQLLRVLKNTEARHTFLEERAAMNHEVNYAHTKKLGGVSHAQAIETVKARLADEGFGVLSEIDVQATLKKKLNVDRPPYVILGACNPGLAHKALEAEPAIGVFLPCNVDVFQGEDGATYVQAVRPDVMFSRVKNPELEPIAADVNERLKRVLAALP